MAREGTVRVGRPSRRALSSFPGYLATRRMVGVDTIVIERLGLEHPLAWHLGDFLVGLSVACLVCHPGQK
jgi:hypothetical protein